MSDNAADSVTNDNAIRLATKVYEALIVQRLTDKYKAIEMLNDTSLRIDRAMLRTLVLKAIRDDYYVGRETELDNADIAFTRSWLLNVLGHVADDDPDAMRVIRKHLKPNEEPNRWGRFWALEGLIASRNKHVRDVAEQVAESRSEDDDLLAPTLAVAYLAAGKDIPALKRIREYLSHVEMQWFALRALRVVPLPATVRDLCRIVDDAEYPDETYDAIVALGNVPDTTGRNQSKPRSRSPVALKSSGGLLGKTACARAQSQAWGI